MVTLNLKPERSMARTQARIRKAMAVGIVAAHSDLSHHTFIGDLGLRHT
jgi:hypothetical protein